MQGPKENEHGEDDPACDSPFQMDTSDWVLPVVNEAVVDGETKSIALRKWADAACPGGRTG